MTRDEGTVSPNLEQPLVLSVEQAAAVLGIGRTTTFGEIQSGRLRSIKVGARRLIPRAAIVDWVDDRLADQLPPPS